MCDSLSNNPFSFRTRLSSFNITRINQRLLVVPFPLPNRPYSSGVRLATCYIFSSQMPIMWYLISNQNFRYTSFYFSDLHTLIIFVSHYIHWHKRVTLSGILFHMFFIDILRIHQIRFTVFSFRLRPGSFYIINIHYISLFPLKVRVRLTSFNILNGDLVSYKFRRGYWSDLERRKLIYRV